jgi:hypothetical protein
MTTLTDSTMPSINILPTTRIGEVGKDGKHLYFPFFLIGTPGDDRGVINYSRYKKNLPLPKKMDRAWFGSIAKHLEAYPLFDWSASTFRKNVLLPNKERIRVDCDIKDDEILDRVINDCDVLLNNFHRWTNYAEWREECGLDEGETMPESIGFPPNGQHFFTHKNLEY